MEQTKKKVLVLDRAYCYKYMKSEVFDVYVVCLSHKNKKSHITQGLNVVGCFEDEYDSLPVARFNPNYLTHSVDSDRFLRHFSLEKRHEILGKEISFWNKILDSVRPDCIVNEVVTIEFMEVMYIEAHKRNIPYYTWAIAPFAPQDFWVEGNPFNTRMRQGFWDEIFIDDNDREKAIDYIEKTRDKGHKPFYINIKHDSSLVNFAKTLRRFLLCEVKHMKLKISQSFVYEDSISDNKDYLNYAWNKLFHKYDTVKYDNGYDYFFYPLHMEPESAVEYAGYYYNDQAMLIGRIAHSLNTNQILIVKEHPQQEGVLMTKKFRELKKRFPNIVYLPGRVSSYTIYPHIRCLVTLNGTAGFESWVCKRPVIVFGEVFYKDFPGVTVCQNLRELHSIIREGGYSVASENDIVNYVAKIFHKLTSTFPYILKGKYEPNECENIRVQIEDFLLRHENKSL